MSTFLSKIKPALVFMPVLVVFMLPLAVMAAKGDLEALRGEAVAVDPPVRITLGKAELIAVDGEISDVLVADPSVVDVMAVQSNSLYVVGVSVGDTNVIALDAEGNIVRRVDFHVAYDLQAVQSLVNQLFPDEDVKVGSIHDQIFLTGTVSTPDVAGKVANIVTHYVSDLQDEEGTIDELISNLLEVRGE